jgi:hypothetical protein
MDDIIALNLDGDRITLRDNGVEGEKDLFVRNGYNDNGMSMGVTLNREARVRLIELLVRSL